MTDGPITFSNATALRARLPSAAVLSKFVATGVIVASIHLAAVTAMVLVGVPIQVAMALGFVAGLIVHFTLNRQWVFATKSGYALKFSRQGMRYLVVAASSYACSAGAVAVGPALLGLSELTVFFLAAIAMAAVTFVVLRLWVFRAVGEGLS